MPEETQTRTHSHRCPVCKTVAPCTDPDDCPEGEIDLCEACMEGMIQEHWKTMARVGERTQ